MSIRRRLTAAAAWLSIPLLACTVAVVRPGVAAAAGYAGYAMAYFTESPSMAGANYGLHLAVSSDGLNWTPLNQNNPVATPTLGAKGIRDPFILRKQDGTFVVLATDLKGTDLSKNSQYLQVWDSPDLRSFTNYRLLKVHSSTTQAWAPEAFWDPGRKQYAIIYSSYIGHNKIMVDYTTDFATATAPQVFFDPGYNVIDGDLVSAGGTNYLYVRNSKKKTLIGARSSSLNPGSFKVFTGDISPGREVEAPNIVKDNTQNIWYMWGDTYTPNGRFFAWQTTDLASGSWTLLNDRQYRQPLNSKHPGITAITATELSNLKAKWGTPNWNRIQSYNVPDRYVRHQNTIGRIDAYPFDPYQDQQWKLVPGLADTAGVSFESVNAPGKYLRQYNYQVQLAGSDGSTAFNGDATFYRTAGFADSGWTSFQSYSFPNRYLRHDANDVLRIDPISSSSSAGDKQDATFRIGS